MFYRSARYEIGVVIWNSIFAPFTVVRFRDFFFADVLTSIGQSLLDIGLIFTYFFNGNWKIHKSVKEKEYPYLHLYITIIAFCPFWWRFWQCINKWYYQNILHQLANALKYCSKFGPIIAALMGCSKHYVEKEGEKSFWWYFTA